MNLIWQYLFLVSLLYLVPAFFYGNYMDIEKTNDKLTNISFPNKPTEEELVKMFKNSPVLRKLAQAVSEEFDENGNYIGK